MEKELNKILEALRKYHSNNEGCISSLLIIGNTKLERVISEGSGDVRILSQIFDHQMSKSEDFNRLMKALLGSWILCKLQLA